VTEGELYLVRDPLDVLIARKLAKELAKRDSFASRD
jgi:hypothetical protein